MVRLADAPAVKVLGACSVIPVTLPAVAEILSGLLKVPCVSGHVRETFAELPCRTVGEAGLAVSAQVGWGAITTFKVALRIMVPLMP